MLNLLLSIVILKDERIKYWLSVGAQTSDVVNNLLIKEGLITGQKGKAVKISKKRKIKLEEKKKEKEDSKVETEVKEVKEEKVEKSKEDGKEEK